MRRAAVILVGLTLSGCAVEEAQIAQRSRSALIGMNAAAIRMCAGHPNNVDKIPGGEVWMYEHGAVSPGGVTVAPVLPIFPFGGATIGSGNGYCRVQLRMVNSRVTEVSYAGATSVLGEKDAVCAPIVSNCLDYRAGRR